MEIASREKMKAAELVQQEVESQRKAELDKYAIDVNNGMEIVAKQVKHGHEIAIEGLKASHAAILSSLDAKLERTSNAASQAVNDARDHINTQGAQMTGVHDMLNGVFREVRKSAALATGRKVIRKNHKGEIEGVDILHPDTGELLASHTALKDKSGRVVGMQ